MLKLLRTQCPEKLIEEKDNGTQLYILKGENVWNKKYIKDALLEISYGKCAYCETKFDKPGNYMEVEHFYHKNKYKNKVLEWENLLPACKKCNGTKNDHDVGLEPIINPFLDNPQEHMYLKNYRLKGKDELGKTTIDVLNLNEREKMVKARFEIGNKVIEKLEEIHEAIDEKIAFENSTRKRFLNRIKALLREGGPMQEYSVVVATTILEEKLYHLIKEKIMMNKCWDEEFQNLEGNIKKIALLNKV